DWKEGRFGTATTVSSGPVPSSPVGPIGSPTPTATRSVTCRWEKRNPTPALRPRWGFSPNERDREDRDRRVPCAQRASDGTCPPGRGLRGRQVHLRRPTLPAHPGHRL